MTRLGSIASFCFLVAVALPLSAAVAAVPPWSSEHDAGLGFTYSYPHGLFSRIAGDGKPSFHYFVSPNSEAKLMVGAWNNREGRTPTGFKHWLLANAGGYDELTYRPRGRSWFVLSGYRGHDIYYEKVMFSCSGEVVNVLALTYPADQRNVYDPVVEHMEDTFRPGSRCF